MIKSRLKTGLVFWVFFLRGGGGMGMGGVVLFFIFFPPECI